MEGIEPGRGMSLGDLEHEMEDVVAVAERFLAKFRARGALEFRIFPLQPVQRATLYFGFPFLQGGENAQSQRIRMQPRLPIPD